MAGMNGFAHKCSEKSVEKKLYHCSLRESCFSDKESELIWDFYVARSFAAETAYDISLKKYGWNETTSKTDGYCALEELLAENADISSFVIIRGKTIKDTLSAMDLYNDRICVVHPRAVLTQDFTYKADENEFVKVDSKESRINAIFRHIRNSFAHGNTYFFKNEMCLLEDKDGKTPTAAILLPKQSLVDWIYIVDKNRIYYKSK